MRGDLIVGFYGDKNTGYKGIVPKRVLELTKACEKDMIEWLNQHQNLEIKDLKNYKPSNSLKVKIEAEEFQFDNGIICGETGMAFMDESSDEEN